MKTSLRKTVLLFFTLGIPVCGFAQEQVITTDQKPDAVLVISTDKAGEEIVQLFERTQSRWFQDPKAPRFLLTDKKGKFALGIGGHVRGIAEVDFDGISENIDFLPTQISSGRSTNYAREQFQMDVTSSTLYLKMVGNTGFLGDFVMYAAADFRGPSRTFRLRNAYASFVGITVGYDFGSFMDLAALPPTIDGAGPSGSTSYRATQIRYTYDKLKNWQFTLGVEMPEVDGLTHENENLSINTQHAPDVPVAAQYSWNKNSHVRVGGVLRNMSYNSITDQKNYSKTGWGVQTSTMFTFGKSWQAFGQFTYGKGIANYMEDITNLGVDLALRPEDPARMQILPMMGWYAGLRYNITSDVFLSSTYSVSRLYSKDGYASAYPDMYRLGQYFVINAFYDVNDDVRLGVEYLRGWKTEFSDATHRANRINLLVQYSF